MSIMSSIILANYEANMDPWKYRGIYLFHMDSIDN